MTGQDILYAKSLLEQGKLVAIPTETVYGLAGNALDEQAVLKIFEAKNRPHFDPLIIHLSSLDQLSKYVQEVPDVFLKIAVDHCPGPLTFLMKKNNNISDLVTSGSDLVAVRFPAHPLTMSLLQLLDFPLAAPSANPFGYISPTTARHVEKQLGEKIDYILDGGPCDIGLESTIIGLNEEQSTIVVYRKGGLEIESLSKYGLPVEVKETSTSRPSAPGMLLSHYAPTKMLFLADDVDEAPSTNHRTAYLVLQNKKNLIDHFGLSSDGDLREAAKNLFAMMRELDEDDRYDVIIAEKMPESGLGLAINDRLKRAAYKAE